MNIANLTLARASSRVREIAVRRALGATRGQLVRQLLVESLVVAVAGGAAALVALAWSKDWIVAMMPADLPRLTEVQFDGGMVAIGSGAFDGRGRRFGIVPAMQVSGVNPGDNLKDAGRGRGAGRARAPLPRRAGRGGNRDLARAPRRRRACWCAASGACCRSIPDSIRRGVGFAQIWIPVPNDPSKNPYGTPAQRNAYINEVLRRVARAARRRVGRDERQQPDAVQRIRRDAALHVRRRIDGARGCPPRAVPGRQPAAISPR